MDQELEEKARIIEELEADIIQSATLGKELLDRNNELEQQIKEQEDAYADNLDALKQENFCLRNRIENQEKLVSQQHSDLEQMRTAAQEREWEHLELEKLRVVHAKAVSRWELKVSQLIDELDSANAAHESTKDRLQRQEQLLSEWKERETNKSSSSFLEVEVGSLQSTVDRLDRANEELQMKLQDGQAMVARLSSDEEKYKSRIVVVLEEVDCRGEEITSLQTALQATKEKNLELSQEVQMLKMDSVDINKRKGNSLFSEVDDRRIETERRFISLKVKHESLEKAHTVAQHQLRRLKGNMRCFLVEKGQSTAVGNHAERLERAVASYRSQVLQLQADNRKLKEAVTASLKPLPEVEHHDESESDTAKTMNRLTAYYVPEVKRLVEQNDKLEKKIYDLQMGKLWDDEKLRECDYKLLTLETEAGQLRSNAVRYKQKLQESVLRWKEERLQREKLKSELKQLELSYARDESQLSANQTFSSSQEEVVGCQQEKPDNPPGSSFQPNQPVTDGNQPITNGNQPVRTSFSDGGGDPVTRNGEVISASAPTTNPSSTRTLAEGKSSSNTLESSSSVVQISSNKTLLSTGDDAPGKENAACGDTMGTMDGLGKKPASRNLVNKSISINCSNPPGNCTQQ